MAVLHDYKCKEHGYFEAWEAVCPQGCTEDVMLVFLQAPSLMSESTKKNDQTIKNLASDFGMTNLRSTKEGENQSGYFTRNNKSKDIDVESQSISRESNPRDAAIWGGGFKNLNMKSILSGRAVQSVRGESVGINPKEAGNLTGPRAASYTQDHDNLKIEK